jgi:GT2 family glycosyltransferase/glycosyltransferase involved in cell wall biosynthesis
VVCFSIIDWESRWQRPQQLASKFADNGHRVFYVRMSGFLPPGGPPYELVELRENVWSVTVATRVHPRIYDEAIDATVEASITDALTALRADQDVGLAVSLVEIATWRSVAEHARELFGWPLVYDCMDEWHGFPGIADPVVREEVALAPTADLIVASASRLVEKFSGIARRVVLARNGADFERFAGGDGSKVLPGIQPPVVGYFGVIDEWFDIDLLVRLARTRPSTNIVLVGPAEIDVSPLERLANVTLLGLRPYDEMPGYLARFDVCLMPFLVNATTEAQDHVKFYEYLSRGKPVVATALPELDPYRAHVYVAADHDAFIAAVDAALVENDPARRESRVALAKANDWQDRYDTIEQAIAELWGLLSVVVVTYGNLALTQQCIESLLSNTTHPRFELIVVDNSSTDGTPEYLQECASRDDRVRIVLNDENRGFAAAVNQGLGLARGDLLVIMNNDLVVPCGWQAPMLRHLNARDVGLVVAVTNNSGNESRIAVTYSNLEEMEDFAAERRRTRDGYSFDIRVAMLYCVALRRDVFDKVGLLDERFGLGWFEDDDYSHRARLAGFRIICADDAFVHHHGQAAFTSLTPHEQETLWKENQQRFEEKWGLEWESHTLRAH